jgi:hypothetical protein
MPVKTKALENEIGRGTKAAARRRASPVERSAKGNAQLRERQATGTLNPLRPRSDRTQA